MKLRLLVIICSCVSAFGNTHSYPPALEDNKISISDKAVQLDFLSAGSGFGLISIQNPETGHDFLGGEAQVENLWKIKLRNAYNEFLEIDNTVSCTRDYKMEHSPDGKVTTLHLLWKGIEIGGESDALDVEVKVRLDGSGLSYWTINVTNNSREYGKRGKGYGAWEVLFPVVRGVKASEGDDMHLAIPKFIGQLLKDPVEKMPLFMRYPSVLSEMQFSTLFESDGQNGLFLGTFDGDAYIKQFRYDIDREGMSLKYEVINYPEGMGQPAIGFEMPYEAVIGVYEGDWITACKIYRKWAVNQYWCSKGTLSVRDDIPQWYKNNPVWFSGLYTDRMIPLARYLDVPVAFHWYQWHVVNDPIIYSPDAYTPSEEFLKEAAELQNAGIKIVPYINSRLWNINSKSWHEEKPYSAVTKLLCQQTDIYPYAKSGRDEVYMYTEHWEVREAEPKSTERTTEAVMCPFTDIWQKQQSDIVKRLASCCNVDGIYLDQMSGMPGVQCFDPGHGHTIGGGNYWTSGYRKMIELIKKDNPGVILTSEDHAESYLDLLDGNLACNLTAIAPDLIPMFYYVYKDYCISFGRMSGKHWYEWHGDKYSKGLPLIMRNAQMFTWGEQLGWFNPNILEFPCPEAEYIKMLSKAKEKESVKKFLLYGEMVRPPVLQGDNPVMAAKWSAGQEDTKMPAVVHSAWKADDGSLGLVFTNMDTLKHTVNYSVGVKQFQLPSAKQYRVIITDAAGSGKPVVYRSKIINREEVIAARSYLVIEIAAVK